MLDVNDLPSQFVGDVQVFNANSATAGANWATWYKPRGKSMCSIWMVGAGGGGGDAVAGAASTAAGGGGGGSGSQTHVVMPLSLLPDILYVSVARGNPNNTSTTAAAGVSSYVAVTHGQGAPGANAVVAQANAGASGGKSAGATPGPVGTAGAIATAAQMPLGFGFAQVLAGQVGIIGSNTAGAALTLPVTGLVVTGGTGGAGIPAISTNGNAGGLITGVAGTHVPVSIPGGVAGTNAPTGGGNGVSGTRPWPKLGYWLGGTGGGSSGLAAATGSTGGNGGTGATGCGGGGGGGAFTGSAFGVGGWGGDSIVIITCW